MTSRFAPALALLAALLLPTAVQADAVAPTDVISVNVGQGDIVRIAAPAATVFIADPTVADVNVRTPHLVYLLGKKPGRTTFYAMDAANNVVLKATVAVTLDMSQLNAELAAVSSGAIHARSVGGAVFLEGVAGNPEEAASAKKIAGAFADPKLIVSRLKTDASQQIELRVRIAEMSRTTARDLGVNWDAVSNSGGFLFGLASGMSVVSGGAVAGAVATGASNLVRQNGEDNLYGSFSRGRMDINGMIDALDQEGLVKLLAEPNLSAASGQPASFLAGGQFPIPVPQGNNTVGIQYENYGVSLSFVGTILDGGRISLHVKPEVSELSTAGSITIEGTSVPSLTTREADTTIDVGSGQSFAIAGLLQSNAQSDLQALPGLGSLPVLGQLFRSTQYQKSETELVIIVTPYLVKPVSAVLEREASVADSYATPAAAASAAKAASAPTAAPVTPVTVSTLPAPGATVAAPASPAVPPPVKPAPPITWIPPTASPAENAAPTGAASSAAPPPVKPTAAASESAPAAAATAKAKAKAVAPVASPPAASASPVSDAPGAPAKGASQTPPAAPSKDAPSGKTAPAASAPPVPISPPSSAAAPASSAAPQTTVEVALPLAALAADQAAAPAAGASQVATNIAAASALAPAAPVPAPAQAQAQIPPVDGADSVDDMTSVLSALSAADGSLAGSSAGAAAGMQADQAPFVEQARVFFLSLHAAAWPLAQKAWPYIESARVAVLSAAKNAWPYIESLNRTVVSAAERALSPAPAPAAPSPSSSNEKNWPIAKDPAGDVSEAGVVIPIINVPAAASAASAAPAAAPTSAVGPSTSAPPDGDASNDLPPADDDASSVQAARSAPAAA